MVDGYWSISCNFGRHPVGSVGWFARFGYGSPPPLVGFMMVTSAVQEWSVEDDDGATVVDASGAVVYEPFLPGRIHGWSPRLWVPGTDLAAAGWPATHAPWGAKQQCQNGQRLDDTLRDVILDAIDPSIVELVAFEVGAATGNWPGWAAA